MKLYLILLLIHHSISMYFIGRNITELTDRKSEFEDVNLLGRVCIYAFIIAYMYTIGFYVSLIVEVLWPKMKEYSHDWEFTTAYQYYFTNKLYNADAAGIRRLKEWKDVIDNRRREGRSELWYKIKAYWIRKVLERNNVFYVPYVFKELEEKEIDFKFKIHGKQNIDSFSETNRKMNAIIYRGNQIVRQLKNRINNR